MTTWHQQRVMVPLYHETKWTVVEDRGHTSVSRWDTNEQAQTHLNNLNNKCGNGKGAYILPPMGKVTK